jgi:hypothetical protein
MLYLFFKMSMAGRQKNKIILTFSGFPVNCTLVYMFPMQSRHCSYKVSRPVSQRWLFVRISGKNCGCLSTKRMLWRIQS